LKIRSRFYEITSSVIYGQNMEITSELILVLWLVEL
jgi:hypothetical protein